MDASPFLGLIRLMHCLDFLTRFKFILGMPCLLTPLDALLFQGRGTMLVMECMDHGSLYDLIHNDTMVMEGEIVLSIMRDVIQGILYLHSNR